MDYCTIIQSEETRFKLVSIAKVLNLDVSWTSLLEIDLKHAEKHNTYYYLILSNDKITNLYGNSGRLVTNETFLKKMYQKSIHQQK